jgi:hypothetical protein
MSFKSSISNAFLYGNFIRKLVYKIVRQLSTERTTSYSIPDLFFKPYIVPYTDEQVFLTSLYLLVCTVNKFSLTSLYLLVCTVNKFSLTSLYLLVCAVNKFSLTSLYVLVCTDTSFPWQVYTFLCVRSTSFPWQVYTFLCVQSTSFLDKFIPSCVYRYKFFLTSLYLLVCTVNKFSLTSFFACVVF